jgi:hypothetical protein
MVCFPSPYRNFPAGTITIGAPSAPVFSFGNARLLKGGGEAL